MSDSKKKLNRQESKAVLPVLEEFNKLSKSFIQLLQTKKEKKERSVSTIRVLVGDMKIPSNDASTLSIRAIDINNTEVRRKGKGKFKQHINWEDDFRNQKRGKII